VSLRTLKVIFGAVTVCFLVASAYIAVLVTERQKVLGDITHYNPAWLSPMISPMPPVTMP
jgi:hypothetical protein